MLGEFSSVRSCFWFTNLLDDIVLFPHIWSILSFLTGHLLIVTYSWFVVVLIGVYMYLPVPVALNHNSCFDFEFHGYTAVAPERLYSLVESVAACRVSVGKDWAICRFQGVGGPRVCIILSNHRRVWYTANYGTIKHICWQVWMWLVYIWSYISYSKVMRGVLHW